MFSWELSGIDVKLMWAYSTSNGQKSRLEDYFGFKTEQTLTMCTKTTTKNESGLPLIPV